MNNPINYDETMPESFNAAYAERERTTVQAASGKALLNLLQSLPHDHPARIHVEGLLFAAHAACADFPCEIDDEPDYVELTIALFQMIEDHGKRLALDGLLSELP
jgi:hypothetical protein